MRQTNTSEFTQRRRRLGAAAFGFTLVELLIVIAVIGVLAVMIAPVLPQTLISKDLETSAAAATDALRRAQGNVMTGRDYVKWGVHLEADRIVLFSGASYAAGNADNDIRLLNGEVRITDVSLEGAVPCTLPPSAGCNVHFEQTEGVPSEYGTISLRGADGETRTVTVNAAGMTDFQ